MRYYFFHAIILTLLMITFIIVFSSSNYHVTNSSSSFEQCQKGRVCTNSCYFNGQLINCTVQNISKSVLFNPSFGQMIPDVQLRLVQIEPGEGVFNLDVTLTKENLTPYGVIIHFGLSADSAVHIFCADWLACSSDTNHYG